jgi:hypothetical protein
MILKRRDFLQAVLGAGLEVTAGGLLRPTMANVRGSIGIPTDAVPGQWLSHRPMRALPTASNRVIDETSRAYFLSPEGDDARSGTSEGRAWRTLTRAARGMAPGDTLYLKGGHYWLTSGYVFNTSGTAANPITIRPLPGELAILDCGYREFFERPDTAWEPCPASQGGVEGEYWSTRVYPLNRRARVIAGNFGDSMVPLFRYATMIDLRSENEFFFPALANNNYEDPTGIYCGPGAMWNPTTGRIHIRLAHTHIEQLAQVDYLNHGEDFDHNYTGETDPRNLPLILSRSIELAFRSSHIRVQDLVFQGQRRVEFGDPAAGHVDVHADGVHVYAGPEPFGVLVGGGGKLLNAKIRGFDAPWTNRFTDKNRTSHGVLVVLAGSNHEVAHCEFTDHHDGVAMTEPNRTVDFHHNLVENMNDDALFLNPRHPTRVVRVWQNAFAGATSYLPFTGGGQGVGETDEAGCYIFRNFFDLRRQVYGSPPRGGEDSTIFRRGLLTNEHSNSVRPNVYFYHNDIALPDGRNQDWYMARWGDDYGQAVFKILNNILVQVIDRPQDRIRVLPAGGFESRSNLLWGLRAGSSGKRPGDIHADPEFVRFTDDWRDGTDLHLLPGSPAIAAGAPLPEEWPDPLRPLDKGAPDIGAIPLDVVGTVFGPHADR